MDTAAFGRSRPSSPGTSDLARPVGEAVHFLHGPLMGQTLRGELQELQKAELGRKYVRKDRRAIDPPPVVRLRLFRISVDVSGRQIEQEVEDYTDVPCEGFLCHVDLFPIPAESSPSPMGDSPQKQNQAEGSERSSKGKETEGPPGYDALKITQGVKCTEELAGSTFVQAVTINYKTGPMIMFVFADLSVKMEGFFIPRYRCFNLLSNAAPPSDRPILAECLGGPFQIYSTKDFPGLKPSTELTKHLSIMGVRTNSRENERTRKPRGETAGAGSAPKSPSTSRSRKRKAQKQESDEESIE